MHKKQNKKKSYNTTEGVQTERKEKKKLVSRRLMMILIRFETIFVNVNCA